MSTISSRDGVARARAGRRGHQDARRAEAALERVVALERLLQRRQHASAGERLDGLHRRAVDLDREQAAAAHRDAVEAHRAGAADAVLAADVGAGEPEAVPEEVGQEQPRLDVLADDLAVDGQRDLGHAARSQAAQRRSTSVPVKCGGRRRTRGSSPAGRRPGGERARLRAPPRSPRSRRPAPRPRRARRPVGHRADPDARLAATRLDRGARPPPSRARSRRAAARAPRTRRLVPAPRAARSSRRRARPARASSGSG